MSDFEDDWLAEAQYKIKHMPEDAKLVRERALSDLYFFARLVNKGYMYGGVHREVFSWMQEYSLFGMGGAKTSNKLIMLPRGHLKSHMVATWVAWIIARHPEVTMLYVSATSKLAETQLFAIQNILGSKTFMRYFPEYVNPQEGKREKWNSKEITVDHPKRAEEGIRDATVITAGLTTNTTGWHADIILADDLVVPENAYTEDGRDQVIKKVSQFTSIRNTGGFTMACGTRYHPKDIYDTWKKQTFRDYDDEGLLRDILPVWEIKEYVVEEDNVFIWPRAVRDDGKAFGFDKRELARIEAEYEDKVQFHSQYYNDPNESSSHRLSRENFQYYNPKFLEKNGSRWSYNGKRLNIYAAIDFAFSLNKKADYTAIVVIGIDHEGNYYVLDIDRFKSDRTKEYYDHIVALHSTWGFSKLRAEVTVAQVVIVNGIKDYIKQNGLSLPVEDYRPSAKEGSKEERIRAALEPLYDDLKVWHREGGWTYELEEELIMAKPPHDDLKDSLASAVEIAVKPKQSSKSRLSDFFSSTDQNNRFGGVSFR
jgi:phage terminase large subunit-like protein